MVNLFKNISDKNREKILKIIEADTFAFEKNTTILSTLKYRNIICYIVSGYVQIIQNDYNGNKTIIEELEEGSVFGTIISSISNSDYDIITKEDTTIIIMEYNKILTINSNLNGYNQFIKNLFQINTNQMMEKNDRIQILVQKTIRSRLLEYFEICFKRHNSKNIYLPFTFTDLANYLAIDRCAMSRELSFLKSEKFIEIKGRRITLLYKNDLT